MEIARVVLGIEEHQVAEEVLHFLDRTGRTQVVGTAADERQLAEAVRQLEPDAVVASTALVRDRLDGRRVLAVETAESVRSLRSAIRVGAAGYYVWPRERDALASAAAIAHRREGSERAAAPVVAVLGSRGGIGATFVATHLAAAFARRSLDCALVDVEVPFAGVTGALGVPADDDIPTAADLPQFGEGLAPSQMRELLWRHPEGFGVLLSPGRADAVGLGPAVYGRAIASLSRGVEVVVLHLPREVGAIARIALAAADPVLVVLGLDVASFRDARCLIEATGIADRSAFVVNRAARSEITPADVERVFGRPPMAVIANDRAVRAAQDHGRLLGRRGSTGRAIDRLARRVLEATS